MVKKISKFFFVAAYVSLCAAFDLNDYYTAVSLDSKV